MGDKFQNKYRTQSLRLQNWDYGWNGFYFVTICTEDKKYFFGNIVDYANGVKMKLSNIGLLAEKYWAEIAQRFSYAKLDSFIIMPNHIHGIIVIDKTESYESINKNMDDYGGDAINRVSTLTPTLENEADTAAGTTRPIKNSGTMQNNKTGGITGNKNPMLHENLSRIIRWYKGRVSFEARKINPNFLWQSRFYEHIIRNEKSYRNIAHYIINNPAKWARDRFNQEKNQNKNRNQ